MYFLYINEWVDLWSVMFISCLPIYFWRKRFTTYKITKIKYVLLSAFLNQNITKTCMYYHWVNRSMRPITIVTVNRINIFVYPYSNIFIWLLNETSWLNWKKSSYLDNNVMKGCVKEMLFDRQTMVTHFSFCAAFKIRVIKCSFFWCTCIYEMCFKFLIIVILSGDTWK